MTSFEPRLVGASAAIQSIRADITAAARSNAKVLITGDTGAGKEVVARRIHAESARCTAPLTALNCAGLTDTLLESELFGHVRGSFTGAYRDKPGLLEIADRGTLFLDEVGEMSARMQGVLLRFLETGEVQKVGADRAQRRTDVRVIAATNRDLGAEASAGRFRQDLYYRLNVIRIEVPALRDRPEDIPLLVDHLIETCSREARIRRPAISTAALEALAMHSWPGNVRELKNVIERMLLRCGGATLDLADVSPDIRAAAHSAPAQRTEPADEDLAVALVDRMVRERISFWAAVYPAFMQRDLTRDVLRRVVGEGLRRTAGNYRMLMPLFHMAADDYKRFLGFLRKHDCQLPFQQFRVVASGGMAVCREPHYESRERLAG